MKITIETDLCNWRELGSYVYGYNAREFLRSIEESNGKTMLDGSNWEVVQISSADIFNSLQGVIEEQQGESPEIDISDLLCYDYEVLCRRAGVPDVYSTFVPNMDNARALLRRLPDTPANKCAKLLFGVIDCEGIELYRYDEWRRDLENYFFCCGDWAEYIETHIYDLSAPNDWDYDDATGLAICILGLTGKEAKKYQAAADAGKIDPAKDLARLMSEGFDILCDIFSKSNNPTNSK